MGKTVVVAGIPGVGKTTVLDELRRMLEGRADHVEVVNFGTVMKELFEKAGERIHRDEMRRRSLGLQKEVQVKAAALIAQKARRGAVIVDTHMFVETGDGLLAGTPSHVLTELKPSALILIEAEPEEIAKRRFMDKERVRGTANHKRIIEELAWSRATAAACAVLTGAPVKIITNEEGKQREAARAILELL